MNKKIQFVLHRVLNLGEDTDLEALSPDNHEGWDSSRHIEIVLALEQEFDISFTTDEIIELEGFHQIESIVEGKLCHRT